MEADAHEAHAPPRAPACTRPAPASSHRRRSSGRRNACMRIFSLFEVTPREFAAGRATPPARPPSGIDSRRPRRAFSRCFDDFEDRTPTGRRDRARGLGTLRCRPRNARARAPSAATRSHLARASDCPLVRSSISSVRDRARRLLFGLLARASIASTKALHPASMRCLRLLRSEERAPELGERCAREPGHRPPRARLEEAPARALEVSARAGRLGRQAQAALMRSLRIRRRHLSRKRSASASAAIAARAGVGGRRGRGGEGAAPAQPRRLPFSAASKSGTSVAKLHCATSRSAHRRRRWRVQRRGWG